MVWRLDLWHSLSVYAELWIEKFTRQMESLDNG